MPASTVIKHFKDGTLTLADGSATPVTLVVPFSIGDFKLSGLSGDLTETKVYKVRGVKQTIRKGESSEPTFSFSCYLADYSDVADNTLLDFIMRRGSYTTNVSTISPTSTPNGDVYALNLTWRIEGTDLGDPADHSVTLEKCVCTCDLSEGEPNAIAISGTVYGLITFT